jgi:hypothetical protein
VTFGQYSRAQNAFSQFFFGTDVVKTDSKEYQDTDTVVAIGMILLPGPGGKYKAANVAIEHRKAIKAIVMKASKSPGLSDAKIAQLRRVVEKAGGRLRTEIGKRGGMNGILHSQVEGFGTKIASRHIIHLIQ